MEIKTDVSVSEILTVGDKAFGVKCSNNENYYSDNIISSVTPRITFEKLLK